MRLALERWRLFGSFGAACVVALLAAAAGPVGTADAIPRAQTVVSLTFDDNPQTQWAARQTLLSHGMRATFYTNSGLTADESGGWRLTWSQLHDLAADGHEIAGHTLTHQDLTLLTTEEQRHEACDDRSNILNRGFTPVSSFAYPYGAYEQNNVKAVIQECGYSSARTVGGIRSSLCPTCPFAETIPPLDPFVVRTVPDIRDTTTLATMQQYVTQAENNGGGWVVFVFHHICDSGCGEYATSLAQLTAFLDWLQPRAASGTVVNTVNEVIGQMPPPPPPPPAPPPPPPPPDTTAPITTIACNATMCGTAWYSSAVTIALTASDAGGSGVAVTRYTTDGTDPTSNSTTYTAPFPVSQTTPVKFRSWDNAGNIEETKTQIVRVDTVSPFVSITSPTEGTIVDRRSFTTITAAATDGDSGVTRVAFYGDTTLIGTSTSAPYHVRWRPNNRWTPGEHVLTAIATDAAGHTTTSPGVTVTVR